MEDSHIADLNLGNDRYIFGVFDGHGGSPLFPHPHTSFRIRSFRVGQKTFCSSPQKEQELPSRQIPGSLKGKLFGNGQNDVEARWIKGIKGDFEQWR